jgi:superfamily II DNA or RNA helicase
MKGLYLLTSTVLDDTKIIKPGMSERLEGRVYDYRAFFVDAKYEICYIFSDKYNKNDILYIEYLVLYETYEFYTDEVKMRYPTEYRQIDKKTIHEIIVNILTINNIDYKIDNKPNYDKPIDYKLESTDRTDELKNIKQHKINEIKKSEIKYDENKLYPYQINYIKTCISEIQQYGKVLLVCPTGGGKTLMSMYITIDFKPKKILIITPRIDINNKLINEYLKRFFPQYKIYTEKIDENFVEIYKENQYLITIFCCQKINVVNLSKLKQYKLKFDFCWIDEVHISISKWAINEEYHNYIFKIPKMLFTTATPNIDMKEIDFGKIVNLVNIKELINLGYLCDFKITMLDTDENIDLPSIVAKHFIEYKKHRGLIFHNKQKNAKKLCKQLKHNKVIQSHNINITSYVGNDSYDKLKQEFEDYKGDSICNCVKKISMGYDYPPIDYTLFADDKTSESDILQAIGRGLRIDKNNIQKILDVFIPKPKDDIKNSTLFTILRCILDDVEKISHSNHNIKSLNEIRKMISKYIPQLEGYNIETKIWNCMRLTYITNIYEFIKSQNMYYINNEEYNNVLCYKEQIREFLILNQFEDDGLNYSIKKFKDWFDKETYVKIINLFSNNKIEICSITKKNKICSLEQYSKSFRDYKRLPPVQFISNGFVDGLINCNIEELLYQHDTKFIDI